MNKTSFTHCIIIVLFIGAGTTSWDSRPCSKPQVITAADVELKQEPAQYLQDIQYGPHERNRLDLWLVKSDKPTPLVLFIHGGGFMAGDKSNLSKRDLNSFLEKGYSVAAINYRLTNTAPAPAAYLDCGRALQFLRYNAKKWNIDPELVASTGSSAGAGISMWLGFHDDLSNSESDDPIARQSTRLTCIAVRNGQSSYDPRFAEKIGIPRPNFERHKFFLPFYNITAEETDSPLAYQRYEEAAPITYISSDDPPVFLSYTWTNEEVDENTTTDHMVHHPKLGIALKEQLNAMSIECIIQYPDKSGEQVIRHGAGPDEPPVNAIDFITKYFEIARSRDNN